jgi:hypothetical protein
MQSPGTGRYLITAKDKATGTTWFTSHMEKLLINKISEDWYTYTSDINITESGTNGVVITRIADAVDTAGRSWVTFQNN